MFYSQSGQDAWVAKLLEYKRDGYFLEIGAWDGIATSNTYFFETELGWKGICVEAKAEPFGLLQKNRSSINVNAAISDYDGTCHFGEFRIERSGVPTVCMTLDTLLERHHAPAAIDYLSLDIEGSEYQALLGLDLGKWDISVMTIEHNVYFAGPANKDRIFDLLSNNGYVRVIDDAKCLDDTDARWFNQPYEDWYVSKRFLER